MTDFEKMPNRAPDDRPEPVVMELFIYRDGEEGCEHPALLRATVDPDKIRTVRALRWVLHRAASEWVKTTQEGRDTYENNGESLSLMDLEERSFDGVVSMAHRLGFGLWRLDVQFLTPAASCWDEDLITE